MQFIYLLLALSFLNTSQNSYQELSREVYEVQSIELDSIAYYTILPYKTELDAQMNHVLCHSKNFMDKGKPESLLGNWISDASLNQAQKLVEWPIDLAFFNSGGLRSNLPKGAITKRDLYQLMPFENELVVLQLSAEEFEDLKTYFTKTEGQPMGISSNYSDNKSLYYILTTDYLANGGDKMSFFKDKHQHHVGLKMRDALIQECLIKDTIYSELDQRHLRIWHD